MNLDIQDRSSSPLAKLRACLSEMLRSSRARARRDRRSRALLQAVACGTQPRPRPHRRRRRLRLAGTGIAIVRDRQDEHALVMFGSPSGLWLDPSDAYREGARIEAGWMLTPLDLHLPTDGPTETAPAVGTVAAILVAPHAEAPLSRVAEAEALAGRGLAGDRYAAGRGTFSAPGAGTSRHCQAEVLDEIRAPLGAGAPQHRHARHLPQQPRRPTLSDRRRRVRRPPAG